MIFWKLLKVFHSWNSINYHIQQFLFYKFFKIFKFLNFWCKFHFNFSDHDLIFFETDFYYFCIYVSWLKTHSCFFWILKIDMSMIFFFLDVIFWFLWQLSYFLFFWIVFSTLFVYAFFSIDFFVFSVIMIFSYSLLLFYECFI